MTTGKGAALAVGCVQRSALSAYPRAGVEGGLGHHGVVHGGRDRGWCAGKFPRPARRYGSHADRRGGDRLVAVGAILAGAIIFFTGWFVVDAIISVVIALLILTSAWRLVRESVDVLLEGTPAHVSLADVERQLAGIPGVHNVHDLHVWTVTSGVVAMSGHVVVRDPERNQPVLETAQRRLADMGIQHITMQIEQEHTCVEPERA